MAADMLSSSAAVAAQAPQTVFKPHVATQADALAAGRKFESMFISQMLKPMFDTLPTDGMFGGGQGEEMFRSMLVENYAKEMANHGNGIGIASSVAHTLLRAQEAQHDHA